MSLPTGSHWSSLNRSGPPLPELLMRLVSQQPADWPGHAPSWLRLRPGTVIQVQVRSSERSLRVAVTLDRGDETVRVSEADDQRTDLTPEE